MPCVSRPYPSNHLERHADHEDARAGDYPRSALQSVDDPASLSPHHQFQMAKAMKLVHMLGDAFVASVPQHFGVISAKDVKKNDRGQRSVSPIPAGKLPYRIISTPSAPKHLPQAPASTAVSGPIRSPHSSTPRNPAATKEVMSASSRLRRPVTPSSGRSTRWACRRRARPRPWPTCSIASTPSTRRRDSSRLASCPASYEKSALPVMG